jgi:hypothetical protein
MKAQKCMIDKQLTWTGSRGSNPRETFSLSEGSEAAVLVSSSMMVLPCLTERTANAFCSAAVKGNVDNVTTATIRN